MRRRDDWWRTFGVVPHVLLKWLVAQHEAETSCRVYINGPLQVQCLERNHVFRRFAAILVNHLEVKLIIDKPVIGYIENRAIFQEQLWPVWSLLTVDIHGSRVSLGDVVCGRRGVDRGVPERPRPE
jgi:hypothetical protein